VTRPFDVDTDAYTGASQLLGAQAAPAVIDAIETLVSALAAAEGMGGTDPQGKQWSTSYDRACGELVDALTDCANGSYKLAALLEQTGFNHSRAESESDSHQTYDSVDTTKWGEKSAICYMAPTAVGGHVGEPPGWGWISAHVGWIWPNGDPGRLHTAAAAWRQAGNSLRGVSAFPDEAVTVVSAQDAPETSDAVATCTAMSGHLWDVASGCDQLANACDDYAGHIDEAHHKVIHELEVFLAWTAGIEGVGAGLAFFTFGGSEAAAQAVEATRAAVTASRVGRVLAELAGRVGAGVTRVEEVVSEVIPSMARMQPLLESRAVISGARSTAGAADAARAEEVAEVGLERAAFGPGKWETTNEAMSTRAAEYQRSVTGGGPGSVYRVDGVKFDGFTDGKLLDAKGPGYAKFVDKDGEFYSWWKGADSLANQALRQIEAAGGAPIEWHVAEQSAAEAMEDLLAARGIRGVTVIFKPMG